ncbi:hypothetical protein DFH09DRAFT_1201764, partial [Mycena vulgaris]
LLLTYPSFIYIYILLCFAACPPPFSALSFLICPARRLGARARTFRRFRFDHPHPLPLLLPFPVRMLACDGKYTCNAPIPSRSF